jgi:hypothetical protein
MTEKPNERALRCFVYGVLTVPMSREQREWCLSEIGSVEGYDRENHETSNDRDLAGAVLSAWRDYCRDKGFAV